MIKSIIRRLFRTDSGGERGAVIEQMKTSFDEGIKRLIHLVHNVSYEEKISLAGQSCMPEEVLAEFAQDSDADVRYAVAENIQAPANVLWKLANDANSYVADRAMRTLIWIFYVRFCLEDLLIGAMQLKQQDVLDAAALRNPSAAVEQPIVTTGQAQKILAFEQQNDAGGLDWLIKLAEYPDTGVAVLDRLSQHKEADVRIAVADNPAASREILQRLAADESADVRYALAENHNIDQTVLLILMSDENPFIAQRAQKTLLRLRRGKVVRGKFDQEEERNVARRARM